MNWSLLLSDVAARVLGLIGLVATAVAVNAASIHWQVGSENFALFASISLFMFAITAFFLLPTLCDQMLKRCISFGPKVIFVIATGIWLFLALLALRQGFKPPHGLYSQYLPQSTALYIMASLCLLFAVFICPFGLMFRSSRRFFIESGDYIEPERAAETPRQQLRKRDFWDHLIDLPLYALLVFPGLAMFFGNTVPTAEWDAWVWSHFWAALAAVGTIAVLPTFLRSQFRPPLNKLQPQSTAKRVMLFVLGGPILALLTLWVLWNHGVPLGWNYLTQNPVEMIEYEVVSISTSRRTRGCIDFTPLHAPNLEVSNCGVDSYWASRLQPGDIVRVSGELSWFGHSFEHMELKSK